MDSYLKRAHPDEDQEDHEGMNAHDDDGDDEANEDSEYEDDDPLGLEAGDDDDDEDYIPKASNKRQKTTPKTTGTKKRASSSSGGGKKVATVKGPTLEKRLSILQRDQLVALCLKVAAECPGAQSLMEASMPAPNFSSTLDDIDKLARAVDRAAPRYANFDHFHYKRVAGHVRALKDRITNASCDVDHGGQPVIAVEFLEQALTKAIEMPTFQQYSDNQARTQAIKNVVTVLLRNLKAVKKSGVCLKPHTVESLREMLQSEGSGSISSKASNSKDVFNQCLELLQVSQ